MNTPRHPQAEHLRLIARDLRATGDVRFIELSEEGVTLTAFTLADELFTIAVSLDGYLDVETSA